MVDDELALADEVVLLDLAVTEVMADVVEDRPQPLSALRPGGVVHYVLGDELVEDMGVPRKQSRKRSSTTAFGSATGT